MVHTQGILVTPAARQQSWWDRGVVVGWLPQLECWMEWYRIFRKDRPEAAQKSRLCPILLNVIVTDLDAGAECILSQLSMTQNWEEWLTGCRLWSHLGRPRQTGEIGWKEPHEVQLGGRTTLHISRYWRQPICKASCQREGPGGPGNHPRWTWAGNMPLSQWYPALH